MQIAAPRPYVLAGVVLAAGGYALAREPASPTAPAITARVEQRTAFRPIAAPPTLPALVSDSDLPLLGEDEAPRGHAPIDDAAEFAMVFSVDGETFVRLSTELRATERGVARLVHDDELTAVIAPVTASAMPAELRAWTGREVWVDGTCRARVIGFAEVSRVAGEPDTEWTGDDEPVQTWTSESLTAANVTLAARLDGCAGSWARATDYPEATRVEPIDAPALARSAEQDLLADLGTDDPVQQQWLESGGDGRWQDAVDITTTTFHHPLTGEDWVFVQALAPGHCGDPFVATMAVYRAQPGSTPRRVTGLDLAHRTIDQVVDLDGDGQPELLVGDESAHDLYDLRGEYHDGISTPSYLYADCGC